MIWSWNPSLSQFIIYSLQERCSPISLALLLTHSTPKPEMRVRKGYYEELMNAEGAYKLCYTWYHRNINRAAKATKLLTARPLCTHAMATTLSIQTAAARFIFMSDALVRSFSSS